MVSICHIVNNKKKRTKLSFTLIFMQVILFSISFFYNLNDYFYRFFCILFFQLHIYSFYAYYRSLLFIIFYVNHLFLKFILFLHIILFHTEKGMSKREKRERERRETCSNPIAYIAARATTIRLYLF